MSASLTNKKSYGIIRECVRRTRGSADLLRFRRRKADATGEGTAVRRIAKLLMFAMVMEATEDTEVTERNVFWASFSKHSSVFSVLSVAKTLFLLQVLCIGGQGGFERHGCGFLAAIWQVLA